MTQLDAFQRPTDQLVNDTTGQSLTCASRRLTLVIVRLGVDHQRTPKDTGLASIEFNLVVKDLGAQYPVCRYVLIWHIPGVRTIFAQEAMFLSPGIEMTASGLVPRIVVARAGLVDMKSHPLAGR
ncbi:hypothetical protein MESS4_430012 [Mesorhizobium sp. STM 4661]|nr:hypothetical protein MESS4_430012 [Mesorhizobium sp. STM 4661]